MMPLRHCFGSCLLAAFIAIATGPFGQAQASAPDEVVSMPPPLADYTALVESIRKLRFREAPGCERLEREHVIPFLKKELTALYAPTNPGEAEVGDGLHELEQRLCAYEQLGLITTDDGLIDRLIEAYADQLVAFYDDKADTVYLIENPWAPPVMEAIATVHELVHVLQNQHFDLATLPLEETHHSDRANAALALVEGDATLAMLLYTEKHASLSTRDALRMAFASEGPLLDLPYLFRREMDFAYLDGLRFVQALYNQGGWAAVNAAYADPPASTEQVLHYTEKYLTERDEPTVIDLPDCTTQLGEGWSLVAQDTLGELAIQVLFRQTLSFLRAAKPSRGWDGDRLHLYRSAGDQGNAVVLVWASAWDTARDAEEFGNAYRAVLQRRWRVSRRGPAPKIEETEQGLLVQGKQAVALVHIAGSRVLIVQAPSATIAATVARYLLGHETDSEQTTSVEGSGHP